MWVKSAQALLCATAGAGPWIHQEGSGQFRRALIRRGAEINPNFAALALAYGWAAQRVERAEDFSAALNTAMQADRPSLIHLRLSSDVSTSRSTLNAIRRAALQRLGA